MTFDYKLMVIAFLFAVLVVVKFLAGSKPYDKPVQRKRRFGFRGLENGNNEEMPSSRATNIPALDLEKEFFEKTD